MNTGQSNMHSQTSFSKENKLQSVMNFSICIIFSKIPPFALFQATEKNKDIHGRDASTTETMQITIVDVNDNPPEFYDCSNTCVKKYEFTGEVLEHFTGSISFNMTVKDPDRVRNKF